MSGFKPATPKLQVLPWRIRPVPVDKSLCQDKVPPRVLPLEHSYVNHVLLPPCRQTFTDNTRFTLLGGVRELPVESDKNATFNN